MGLFDKLKELTKSVAPDIVTDTIYDVLGGNNESSTATVETPKTEISEAVFQPISSAGTPRSCHIFACDENGCDAEFDILFELSSDYAEFDSGAGEIDCSFVYAPGCEHGEYDPAKPCICIGFDNRTHKIISSYLKNGTVPGNATITRLSGCIADYKSEFTSNDSYVVSYCFRKLYENDLYCHIYAEIPSSIKGTSNAVNAENALCQIISTLKQVKA